MAFIPLLSVVHFPVLNVVEFLISIVVSYYNSKIQTHTMVVEADLSVMMICTQKNRAAKPYMHFPYQSLKELTAQKRAGLLWLSPCVPTEKYQLWSWQCTSLSLPSTLHPGSIIWTNAHPQQQAHRDIVCRTCSKVTMGWGKLKPSGTWCNSVRDVLAWYNSPKGRISFK